MLATHPVSALPVLRRHFGSRKLFAYPDEAVTEAVDVRPWLDTKLAAIRAYVSEVQRGAAPGILDALPVADRAELLSTEWFIRREPH